MPAMRLIDDRLQLLDGKRGLRDELASIVHPRAMRHVHLDPVGTVIELLARRAPRFDRPVDQLRPLGDDDLRRITLERVTAGRGNRACGDEHARTRDVALLDGLLDADVAITSALGL